MERYFAHETLDAYRIALEVARWAARVSLPSRRRHLRSQLLRAADSVVLNIAEGHSQTGDSRRNHYRIAKASAAEVCAALDLVDVPEGPANQTRLRSVACILSVLLR